MNRTIIRVELAETPDCVKDGRNTEQEEEVKRTFVPSAVSVPLESLFRCDRQCSEKTLSYRQLASVVVNEGDEAFSTNLCQKGSNKHLQAKGEEPLTNVKWRQWKRRRIGEDCGKRWRKSHICAGCGNISRGKDRRQRSFDSWPMKKSRQAYKVSGTRNRQPENTWSK